jgi:MFS family permease
LIVVSTTIASSRRSERLFGGCSAAQAALSAVAFFVLPRTDLGAPALFAMLAALWLIAAPLVPLVPRHGPAVPRVHVKLAKRHRRGSIAALLTSFLAFYTATGAFWAFAFVIGEWQGLAPAAIGSVMSLSMLLSILGGILVAVVGSRFGRLAPLLAALLGSAGFTALLLRPLGMAGYAAAVCGVNLLFCCVVALFFSLFGHVDRSGRLLSMASLLIGIGLALGPWLLGGSADGGSYRGVVVATLALFVLAPALLLAYALAQRRAVAEGALPTPVVHGAETKQSAESF